MRAVLAISSRMESSARLNAGVCAKRLQQITKANTGMKNIFEARFRYANIAEGEALLRELF
jgi:hypothetical protein